MNPQNKLIALILAIISLQIGAIMAADMNGDGVPDDMSGGGMPGGMGGMPGGGGMGGMPGGGGY